MTPNELPSTNPRRWLSKFGCAFRGVAIAVWQEDSFLAHLPATLLVFALAGWRGVSQTEWLLLVLCAATVLGAEMFNTAIERLAKAITKDHDPMIGDALDIASGAVFMSVIGAIVVGAVILLF